MRRWEVVSGLVQEHGWTQGVELGVGEGRFSSFLLRHHPELTMYGIDLWAPQSNPKGEESYEDWNHQSNLEKCLQTVRSTNRFVLHRMDTALASLLFPAHSIDFVFIDADHGTEAVKRDFVSWSSKIRPGGRILGHDYDWLSVQKALNDLNVQVELFSDNVWMTTTSSLPQQT